MSIRETWRAAAVRDQRQFFADKRGEPVDWNRDERPDRLHECGITVLPSSLKEPLYLDARHIPCPVPNCWVSDNPLYLIAHLNDKHQWDWLDLANKFPPILPEDQVDG